MSTHKHIKIFSSTKEHVCVCVRYSYYKMFACICSETTLKHGANKYLHISGETNILCSRVFLYVLCVCIYKDIRRKKECKKIYERRNVYFLIKK